MASPATIQSRTPKLQLHRRALSPDVQLVRVVGELRMDSSHLLENFLGEIFEAGVNRIVIDFSECAYISSAGIGVLVTSINLARKNGGDLVMVALAPRIKHVFELIGLAPYMRFATSSKEATRLLKAA
jgi:anti-sigma B factor antagonist